ncbi:MAG: hypothetical protein ABI721_02780 [Candidatus Dojkabacteria bacterium]
MADQTSNDNPTLDLPIKNELLLQKLPGLEKDPQLNPESMRKQIDKTVLGILGYIERALMTLPPGGKLNLVFPLEGGYLIYHELQKLLINTDEINIIFASKFHTPSTKNTYVLSQSDLKGNTFVLDDIFDEGTSSQMIQRIAGIPSDCFKVFVFSTKKATDFKQRNVPLYTYEDAWVTSGFGMNSGKFGENEVIDAFHSGRIDDKDKNVLIVMHNEIEILERLCGMSFLLRSFKEVDDWRFNIESLRVYGQLLWQNTLYKDEEEFILMYTKLSELQGKVAVQKFQALGVLKEG